MLRTHRQYLIKIRAIAAEGKIVKRALGAVSAFLSFLAATFVSRHGDDEFTILLPTTDDIRRQSAIMLRFVKTFIATASRINAHANSLLWTS